MSKRGRPDDFFFDDEDDMDYMIDASLEHDKEKDKENEIIGLDEYMAHKPPVPEKPATTIDLPLDDPFASDDLLDDLGTESMFTTSTTTQQKKSSSNILPVYDAPLRNAMDDMAISDDEDVVDLSGQNIMESVDHYPSSREGAEPIMTKSKIIDYTDIPDKGAFVTARCPTTGRNLYFPKKSQGERKNKKDALFKDILSKNKSRSLLMKPVWQLMRDIEKENQAELERLEKEKKEAEAAARRPKKLKVEKNDQEGQLWVDKYRPKTYIELMGDQRLNRNVLRWVKQWDYCVFKKKHQEESQRDKVMRQYKSTFGTDPRFAAYKKPTVENNDPLQRPERKILLMSGPPGFGKTTLAHVIAKQAGYNVIEINASDDRTGEVVRSKIKSALEMQAIIRENSEKDGREMTMTQKPNLLIIDEIDGASSGGGADSFIKQLVQLATAEIDTKKKGKSKDKPLLRPIICICNDVYTPVLRPLRMVAESIVFKKVPMMSIAKILQDVCDRENLDSDLRTLSMLAETTDGDIRSCLNTLQFVRGKSKVFTRDMLQTAGVGSKDMGKSLFSVWEDLFSAPNARHKTSVNKDDFDNNKYLGRLTNAVMSNGEIERIMQGCFEAFPHMRFHDVALQKFCQMSEWLEFYDAVDHRVNAKQEYELYKYLPYPVVNFHRFFAGTSSQEHRVEYPRVEYEVFSTRKQYENLIYVFLAGIHPAKRRFLNRDMIANELVPLLVHIISPELKPTNKQLIKPAEKEKLTRLVDIMIEFGLSFIHEKTEDGQFVFKLEPPIEQLLSFELSTPKSVLPKQYAVRQMISHEIGTEILRRREEAAQLRNGNTKKQKDDAVMTEVIKPKDQAENQISIDFFGRAIVPKPKSETDRPSRNAKMEVDTPIAHINYRYHEGFSNAVRKPMTVQMFL